MTLCTPSSLISESIFSEPPPRTISDHTSVHLIIRASSVECANPLHIPYDRSMSLPPRVSKSPALPAFLTTYLLHTYVPSPHLDLPSSPRHPPHDVSSDPTAPRLHRRRPSEPSRRQRNSNPRRASARLPCRGPRRGENRVLRMWR